MAGVIDRGQLSPNVIGPGFVEFSFIESIVNVLLIFVLRKKGSKTKKRMKEKEIERRLRVTNPKSLFLRLEPSGTQSPRRRESNASAGYTTGPSSKSQKK